VTPEGLSPRAGTHPEFCPHLLGWVCQVVSWLWQCAYTERVAPALITSGTPGCPCNAILCILQSPVATEYLTPSVRILSPGTCFLSHPLLYKNLNGCAPFSWVPWRSCRYVQAVADIMKALEDSISKLTDKVCAFSGPGYHYAWPGVQPCLAQGTSMPGLGYHRSWPGVPPGLARAAGHPGGTRRRPWGHRLMYHHAMPGPGMALAVALGPACLWSLACARLSYRQSVLA